MEKNTPRRTKGQLQIVARRLAAIGSLSLDKVLIGLLVVDVFVWVAKLVERKFDE